MKKIIIIFLLICSCSTLDSDVEQRQKNFIDLNKGQFQENVYKINNFDVFSAKKIKDNEKLTVYIEGDGLAWLDRFTPSSDPTPVNPVAFSLALKDKNDNVIYVSRPCQYLTSVHCKKKIWTSSQYSNKVLKIYEDILKKLFKEYEEIHLVGYSGGAAIVIYLASLEELNIKSIRTIAGNINPDEISSILKLSGYNKTVNFFSLEDKIRNISQTHYYGTKDKVIPKELHDNYLLRNTDNKCVKIQSVNATHNSGWDKFWDQNYQLKPNC